MERRWKALSWAFLFAVFGLLCAFMEMRIDCLLDSDVSAELILAELLHREGKWVMTDRWFYPSEIRVFSFQLIMGPLFGLFEDWHTVRVAGSVICYLLLLGSFFYFCCQTGLKEQFPLAAAFLLLPFCYEYFAVVLYGLFYLPHMILQFLVIGMVLQCRRCESRAGCVLLSAGVGGLSFLGGLGGQRLPVILSAPLVFAACFVAFFDWLDGERKGRPLLSLGAGGSGRAVLLSVYGAVCCFLGLLINQLVFAKQFQFRSYQFVRLRLPSLSQLKDVMIGWLRSLGLWSGRSVWVGDWPTSGALSTDDAWLRLAVSLLLAAVIAGILLYSVIRRRTLSYEARFVQAFLLGGGLVMTCLYTVTTMEFTVRYLLPVTVFSIPAAALFFKEAVFPKKRLFLACLLLLAAGSAARNYERFWDVDVTAEYRKIAKAAVDAGYTAGYASFWNGDVLTELSDGKLEMWVWNWESNQNGAERIDDIFVWLQKADHAEAEPTGPCFVLLGPDEREGSPILDKMDPGRIFYDSGGYVLYGYGSVKELEGELE